MARKDVQYGYYGPEAKETAAGRKFLAGQIESDSRAHGADPGPGRRKGWRIGPVMAGVGSWRPDSIQVATDSFRTSGKARNLIPHLTRQEATSYPG